ncbi:MAG: hypothetical protein ABIG60_00165 [Patescibacteria group bacterium]
MYPPQEDGVLKIINSIPFYHLEEFGMKPASPKAIARQVEDDERSTCPSDCISGTGG